MHRKSLAEVFEEARAASAELPEKTYAAEESTALSTLPADVPHDAPSSAAPALAMPPAPVAPEALSAPEPELPPLPQGGPPRAAPAAGSPMLVKPTAFQGEAPAGKPRAARPALAGEEPRISETFEQSDIREALRLIGSSAGVNIIVDDQVRGSVTATLEDIPLGDALDAVLMPLGLVYAKRGRQYIVGPPDPAAATFSALAEHLEYEPVNQTAPEIVNALPKKLQVFVRAVDKRNLIVIDAPQRIGEDLLRRLQQVDRPVPQVILEAIVCVVNPDSAFHFGMDMGHQVPGTGASDAMNMGFSSLTFSGQMSRYGFNHATDDFAAVSTTVKLLAQEGYLSIRAAPRVMAKDGERAQIVIARESFFSPQQTATASSSSIYFPTNIQKVESGITLNITPVVRGDEITVSIEKAEVSEDINASQSNQPATNTQSPYPIINRRTVSTTVHVQDGHTIVIGGLVQKQVVEQVSHIPGLANIPVVGKLFQTIDRQEQEAEVAILISPRIVRALPLKLPCVTARGDSLPLIHATPVQR